MKNVKVLDCTLRDGGRIINCAFKDLEIKEVIFRLTNAKIDIVEVGFLRDSGSVKYNGDSTFFTDVEQIIPFLDKKQTNTMYVAFIDYGMFDFATLRDCDGKSVDGIRVGFTKKDLDSNLDDIIQCLEMVKSKGYKLFIQGVNSLNYSDREMLELIDLVNKVHPYSFGIVDTYGAMYIDDVDRMYGLIHHNMKEDICIDFHSHNNYQLSFAFAQEIIKLSNGTRPVIIDATLNGMGKVAGNLNTELIIDYLVRKLHYDYEFDDILDIIDDYIYKYSLKHSWGYSIPAMMAGIYKSHPNNVIYLTEKFRLETKDIKNLISMIDAEKRQQYDYDNIEKLYLEYISEKVDDYETIELLKKFVSGKEAFVMVPGNTLNTHREMIEDYILNNNPVIFTVNYIGTHKNAIAFFGNKKRYNMTKAYRKRRKTIITSNVKSDCKEDFIINYYSVINRGYKYFENSTIMLLNLLKRLNVKQITIAGFDGFSEKHKSNYMDESFQNDRHIDEFGEINDEISKMFINIVETLKGKCDVNIITPSLYNKTLRG